MKNLKKVLALVLSVILCLSVLTACGGKDFDAAGLVKGNLDLVYLNQYTEEYLELVSLTAEEANKTYEDGIAVEVAGFVETFAIDLEKCDASIQSTLTDLYKQIYATSKYEVGEVTEIENGYEVAVTIYPIDVIYNVINEECEHFLVEWSLRNENGEFSGMEDSEYQTLWANGIIDMVEWRMQDMGHQDPQTIKVKVTLNADNCYVIDDADFQTIDSLIIAY